MQLYRNILVAWACAEADQGLLKYAAMLGSLGTDANFHLVHVLPPEAKSSPEDILGRMSNEASNAGEIAGKLSCAVLRGDRLDALLKFAAAERVDLLLLGHSRDRSGRRSLARRLAMKASFSVWLVPEGCPAKLEKILAPVDFSPRAGDALEVATALAASARLDECYGLHVRFNPAAVMFDEYQEIEMTGEENAFAIFVARINLHGVDVKPIFEEGPNVASTIRRVAQERQCDLIVMGTRGRSPAASILLGSETEQTMIESTIPVLAVKHFGARLRLLQVLFEECFQRQGDLRFT